MIEILGITIAWETLGFIAAFAASEVIGTSKLKENSVAALVKSLIDNLKPMRREDEKVAAISARIEALIKELKSLGK
jgi:uncharacterized alkaline shock family protein YloU